MVEERAQRASRGPSSTTEHRWSKNERSERPAGLPQPPNNDGRRTSAASVSRAFLNHRTTMVEEPAQRASRGPSSTTEQRWPKSQRSERLAGLPQPPNNDGR